MELAVTFPTPSLLTVPLLQLSSPGNASSSLGLAKNKKPACLAAQKVSFKEENASLSQKVALSLRQVFLNSGAAQTSKNSVLLLG